MSLINDESISDKTIYLCQLKPPILTVVVGAKCSDGMVLIADKKVTDCSGNIKCYTNKIFFDLEHILIGYGGRVDNFDIFRKYIAEDIMLWRSNKTKQYTFENFIPKIKDSVIRFNKLASKINDYFEIIIAKHLGKLSELYYIDKDGKVQNITDYVSFGSGKKTVDMVLKNVNPKTITMKEFAKRTYFAIMYLNTQPDSRVGVEPNGFPTIIYLDYTNEWDKEAPEKDIKEFKLITEKKLAEYDNQLQNLANSF